MDKDNIKKVLYKIGNAFDIHLNGVVGFYSQ